MSDQKTIGISPVNCPLPHVSSDCVLLAHGEGARLTRELVRKVILAELDNEYLHPLADAAVLPVLDSQLVVTTDSFVVSPLFFPGGDIGKLAVFGTINDLAVCGAAPLYLSLGLIIEEGLPIDVLKGVVGNIGRAARECNVHVVAGDTKVVPKGAADGLFINTAGIGKLFNDVHLDMQRLQTGDKVIVSGTIGDHGMAILSAREGLQFEPPLQSDCASIYETVRSLLDAGLDMHFLRDPTRGGVAATLQEVVEGAGCSILLEESQLPISDSVRGACEILGLDPLYVANEGKIVAFVSAQDAERALAALRKVALGKQAAIIGEVAERQPPQVLVRGILGAYRVLDEPSGAPLPRIC